MPTVTKVALWLALLAAICFLPQARAAKTTVCTITVNSADEKETFRRYLHEDKYQFVELVERGRPDWLASACRQHVRCDVLIISGHFNGTEFFSEHLDSNEFLPVAEMERASCSESCPGLFSHLKEVYLFGCNTLNAEAGASAAAEVARSLVRGGQSKADAERAARALNERHSESNRDGMRRIFVNVPVIYGFSSVAPVGAAAASTLNRYFQSASSREIGSGHPSSKLLSQFSSNRMTAAGGMRASDPRADYRQEVCQFVDERKGPAQTLRFIHQMLGRDLVEARMFLDRIESFAASLSEAERQTPSVASALDELARDQRARERFLAFARDEDQPSLRARMIKLAHRLGWLSAEDERNELIRMAGDLLAANKVGSAEVDLICALNRDHALDGGLDRLELPPTQVDTVPAAAVLGCLGSVDARPRVLQALTGSNGADVQIAQVFLRYRPIRDIEELRAAAVGIGQMSDPDAQVRALNALAAEHVSDPESLDELMRLFPHARSLSVQRAIAGIFIRADYDAIDRDELVGVLREHRMRSADHDDIIDALLRRLKA
ncbi:MAG TPA: hypothetical protein VGK37_08025 [Casimicrobiaceae bacterium]|jgi:hypothetical protein